MRGLFLGSGRWVRLTAGRVAVTIGHHPGFGVYVELGATGSNRGRMKKIAERLMNVATIVVAIFAALAIFTTMTEGYNRTHDLYNYSVVLVGILAILAINYIAFGRATLWHRAI